MQTISIIGKQNNNEIDRIAQILKRRIFERWNETVVPEGNYSINLEISKGIGKEGFTIEQANSTCKIVGDCKLGLLYGVGKFLRNLRLEAGKWHCNYQGTSLPEKQFRGMYFATHFQNFYETAPLHEVFTYIEDIALWGTNTIASWFDIHEYNGISDDAAQLMLKRQASFLRFAQELGMKVCILSLSNEAYASSPKPLRAKSNGLVNGYKKNLAGHYHVETCPSIPEGEQYIYDVRQEICEAFKSAMITPDYWMIGPYDQGGCTCSGCAPWGSNGFLRILPKLAEIIKRTFPMCKFILSTWLMDSFIDNELEGLSDYLKAKKPDWIDMVMFEPIVSGTLDYFVRSGIPDNWPIIGFPEISMFGSVPWGGFGTNVTPDRLEENWRLIKRMTSGGLPYSEGIFEDIHKAIVTQHYWDSNKNSWETVKEYIESEISFEHSSNIMKLIGAFEQTLPRNRIDENGVNHDYPDYKIPWKGEQRFIIHNTSEIDDAKKLADIIDKQLDENIRTSWRWRLLFLRAQIDFELYHNAFVNNELSEQYFEELTRMYHAQNAYYCVSPPLLSSIEANRGGFSWTSDD